METVKQMWTDTRKILSIAGPGPLEIYWTTYKRPSADVMAGVNECDEIRPYRENGLLVGVPWFAILRGGEVVARVNAAQMTEVQYVRAPQPRSDDPSPAVRCPDKQRAAVLRNVGI